MTSHGRTAGYIVATCVLAAGVAVVSLNYRSAMRAEVARANQRAALAEASIPAAEARAVAEVRAELRRVVAESEVLRQQIGAAEAALGRRAGTPTEVVRWRTAEIEVPCPPPTVSAGAPPDGPDAPAPSDGSVRLSVSGTWLRWETRAGQPWGVGEVVVTRTHPPPPEEVARLPVEIAPGDWIVPEPPRPVRWLAGPVVGVTGDGGIAGIAVMSPAWRPRLGRWRPEARGIAVAAAGASETVVVGGVVVGW